MKEKEIRRLLHHANIRQIEKVAEHPATDEHTKDRLFRELRRRQSVSSRYQETVTETYSVSMKENKRNAFQPGLVLASAAAVAIAIIPLGLIWMVSRNPVTVTSPDYQPGVDVTEYGGEATQPENSVPEDMAMVPDVTSYRYEYAQKVLENAGFQTETRYERSESVSDFSVIRTDPAAGTMCKSGDRIVIYVSKDDASESALAVSQKEELYYKCMNTLLYLDTMSGTVKVRYGKDTPTVYSGCFAYDFLAQKYYTELTTTDTKSGDLLQFATVYKNHNDLAKIIENTDGKKTLELRSNTLTFDPSTVSSSNSNPHHDDEDINTTFGKDPTYAHEIASSFMPQEMTAGYLYDLDTWEITEIEEYQGRQCAVITGLTEEYGSSFSVTSFKIKIDIETGVWLWYEGYDTDGTVQAYIYTENMQFGNVAQAVPSIPNEEIEKKLASGEYYLINE